MLESENREISQVCYYESYYYVIEVKLRKITKKLEQTNDNVHCYGQNENESIVAIFGALLGTAIVAILLSTFVNMILLRYFGIQGQL